jgi:hypothetical protein
LGFVSRDSTIDHRAAVARWRTTAPAIHLSKSRRRARARGLHCSRRCCAFDARVRAEFRRAARFPIENRVKKFFAASIFP